MLGKPAMEHHDAPKKPSWLMSNLKVLGQAAMIVLTIIVLGALHVLPVLTWLFTWVMAAAALACAVFWGRIIFQDARKGETNYRRLSWEASPDMFVKRRQQPGKFWRLIGYKVLSLLFILALCAGFVLHGLGLFLVS